ncbi:hypothetical protein BDY21DRAFT_348637 [Lineolata rhizophorae]|uniref:Uncharacterized protein n=1 Tax=Lineolata rhizophorae TaxID=578093 RepID=A0A6A6NVM3_9PEZI|nr:hypothetical protein BDY21DRAFT_348637 [Lineolata rhizophorae]
MFHRRLVGRWLGLIAKGRERHRSSMVRRHQMGLEDDNATIRDIELRNCLLVAKPLARKSDCNVRVFELLSIPSEILLFHSPHAMFAICNDPQEVVLLKFTSRIGGVVKDTDPEATLFELLLRHDTCRPLMEIVHEDRLVPKGPWNTRMCTLARAR